MATVYYVGNAITQAQVDTGTVTAVANGGTLTATINGKAVTYTCTSLDTTTTAAAAWQALLRASLAPEFQEINWTVAANVVKATAAVAGTPFSGLNNAIGANLTFSAAGGASVTTTHLVPNKSPSDVSDPNNWNRGGSPALPQAGDDMILQECSVPLLWNLDNLLLVRLATFTRWNSQTGQIGLPTINPLGYPEWRQTYFQFIGPLAGILPMTIGLGTGNGPPFERYLVGGQNANFNALAGTIDFLCYGTNTVNVTNATVSIANNIGEVSVLNQVTVDGGGALTLGRGVTLTGAPITVTNASLNLYANSAPVQIVALGSNILVQSTGQTYPLISLDASTATWMSDSNITLAIFLNASTFDKSQDLRLITITNANMSTDSIQNDPNNTITMTNPYTMKNRCQSGPFIYGAGRTCKVT